MDKERQELEAFSTQTTYTERKAQELRVLRLAEQMGLQVGTVEQLRKELFGQQNTDIIDEYNSKVGAEAYSTDPEKLQSRESCQESQTISIPVASLLYGQEFGPVDTSAESVISPSKHIGSQISRESSKGAQASINQALELELRLRKKIETSQNWSVFSKEAWELYESCSKPEVAARLCELAFLYGSASELEGVLNILLKETLEFYLKLDQEIRLHLFIKLWQCDRTSVLDEVVFCKDLTYRLLPIERLYCCWSYLTSGDAVRAYKFFRLHDQEVLAAQKLYGGQIKKGESEFALYMGKAALSGGDEARALQLLESIPRHAHEFQMALDILLDIRIERDEHGLCTYGQRLQRENDWRGRISLLDSFLLRIQRFEASTPKDRAALNEILKDPFRWFPETPEAWQALVETLLDYQQLDYLLPNIWNALKIRAVQFLSPAFDHALWSIVKKHEFQNSAQKKYWKAVTLLHEFTWNQGESEAVLWHAQESYLEAEEDEGRPLDPSWNQLHRSLLQWISKTNRLDEGRRQKLLLVFKLMGELKDITEVEITQYLGQTPEPSHQVMRCLEKMVHDRGQAGLEVLLLEKKCSRLHYTNRDLERIWQVAAKLNRFDQCWRVVSIARSRLALNEDLERYWNICGEKKREFSILNLQDSQMRIILQSFEGDERRLVESLIAVGPMIPQLLASVNQQLRPLKKIRGITKVEIEVRDALDAQTWLPQGKKIFVIPLRGPGQNKPPFFASLLDTKWALLFMAIAQRLGITAWDWQLSLLNQQIESLVPRMSRASELPAAGKVGRWLRNLTPQQRKSWYELAPLARRFTDEESQLIMARLLAIISSAMIQDHSLAMLSLEKMRAHLRLYWDLEHWIVSENYGQIRKSLGTDLLGNFPKEVYQMPLLKKS